MLSERDKQLFSVVKKERAAKEARKAAMRRAADPKHGGTWPFAKVQLQMMAGPRVFTVHLLAFDSEENLREVTVPAERMEKCTSVDSILDAVFYYGQNDFQPQQMPSVSCGDVIFIEDEIWMVKAFGFQKITPLAYAKYVKTPKADRWKLAHFDQFEMKAES